MGSIAPSRDKRRLSDRARVSPVGSPQGHNSHQAISARVYSDHASQRPLTRNHTILSQTYQVADLEVTLREVPLLELHKLSYVLSAPTLPHMTHKSLAQSPTPQECDWLIRRWRVRNGFERPLIRK